MYDSKVYNKRINKIESVATHEREDERNQLKTDVDKFLASGGKINTIPTGKSSVELKLSKHDLTVITKTNHYRKERKNESS